MNSTTLRSVGWLLAVGALLGVLTEMFLFSETRRSAPPADPGVRPYPEIAQPDFGEHFWLGMGRDFRRSSHQPAGEPLGGLATSPDWRLRLSKDPLPYTESNRVAPLVYDGETIYTAGLNGRVYGIDAGEGELIWERTMQIAEGVDSNASLGGTALGPDHLLVGQNESGSKILWSLGLEDRISAGRIEGESGFFASPLVTGEIVWAPSLDGRVHVFDPDDPGDTVTPVQLGSKPYAAPAHSGNRVVIGSDNGRVAAFEESTGKLIWSHQLAGYWLRTDPVIYRDSVLACGVKGELVSLALSDGRVQWSMDLGTSCNASLVLDSEEEMLVTGVFPYGANPPSQLVGVDLTEREVAWRTEVAKLSRFQIAGAGDYIFGIQRSTSYLRDNSKSYLVALDLATGELAQRMQLPVPDAGWTAVTEQGLAVRLLDGSVALYPFQNRS